jgi:hypothetical protein
MTWQVIINPQPRRNQRGPEGPRGAVKVDGLAVSYKSANFGVSRTNQSTLARKRARYHENGETKSSEKELDETRNTKRKTCDDHTGPTLGALSPRGGPVQDPVLTKHETDGAPLTSMILA